MSIRDRLLVKGPSTYSQLGDRSPSIEDRSRDVNKFIVSSRATTDSNFGQTHGVYYIEGIHEPQEVIQTWLDANDVDVSRRSIYYNINQNYGHEWAVAYRDLRPFEWNTGQTGDNHNEGGKGGTCPLCGEEYDGTLRDHLPCN